MKTEAKFYLEKRKNKATGEIIELNVPIFMFYSFGGKRLQYFTGYRIDAKKWDAENMKVKKGYEETSEINQELAKLKTKVEDEVKKATILNEELTIEDIKDRLKGKEITPKSKKSFKDCFDEYMESSKITKAKGTVRAIQSSYNHIMDFEKDTGVKLEFKKINQEFYDRFLDYCFNERDLKNAYTGKLIKDLKAFLNWETERYYNTNYDFRKKSFKKLSEEIEIIFLTYDELMLLYKHNLDKSPTLDTIRDLFCFGCFTGMRLSDVLSLSHENVHKDKILFRVEKTEQSNVIPLNQYSSHILKKYNKKYEDKCLPQYSEGFINESLKLLFKKVKLNRKVQITHFQGAKKIKKVSPLSEIVTFHMSKKTFMTNFLTNGGSLITAMAITGNKDFKTAKRYFKVVDSLKAEEMAKVFGK